MLTASRDFDRRQRRRAARTVAHARAAWRLIAREGERAIPRYLSRLLPVLTEAQRAAAQDGAEYCAAALAEQGARVDPEGEIIPESLAGIASDGRPLDSLLERPVAAVQGLLARDMPERQALRIGRQRLERIVTTQVADAGRVATGMGVAMRERTGWIRVLSHPACARCVVLAGRIWPWEAGFARHPLCQCISVPRQRLFDPDWEPPEGFPRPVNSRQYFESLSREEQDRIFTKAGARAIRDGADVPQVVNARRGMFTTQDRRKLTWEGTTVRGEFGRREDRLRRRMMERRPGLILDTARKPRMMPEQIYREAADRDEAIRLLRGHGFILERG